MTTTSIDAAQTLPVRLPARLQAASGSVRSKSVSEVIAFPVLLVGLGVVGLGYLGVTWLMISWVLGVVS